MHLTTQRKLLILYLLFFVCLALLFAFVYIGLARAADSALPLELRKALVHGMVFGLAGGVSYGLALGFLRRVANRKAGFFSFLLYISLSMIGWGGIMAVSIFFGPYAALTYVLAFGLMIGLIISVDKILKLRKKLERLPVEGDQ